METIIGGGIVDNKKTFVGHVFSTSEESKAEFLNVMQYAGLGIIPVILLNKTVQKFIPDVDLDKSSLEILAEIFLQILIMFFGIILIHRFITFFPTYSGFKFEQLYFTSFILPFFIIVFSFNSKISAKINILFDRTYAVWNGEDSEKTNNYKKSMKIYSNPSSIVSSNQAPEINHMNTMNNMNNDLNDFGPAPANSFLPGSFF